MKRMRLGLGLLKLPGLLGLSGLVLLAALLSGRPTSAEQLSFSQRQTPDGLAFQVTFDDARSRSWTVVFSLSKAAIEDDGGFARYDRQALVTQVSAATAAAARSYGGAVTVETTPTAGGYQLLVRSRARQPIGEITTALEQAAHTASEAYLSRHALTLLHGREIIPDYPRLAVHYIPVLKPVADALAALVPQGTARDRLELALAFIQSIPYDQAAADSQDIGYAVPSALLARNRGDCDTKSVAMASLLASLLPMVPTVVVVLAGHPGHAFVGVDLPAEPGERSLHTNGRDYLTLEPVGPALLPAGRIAERTARVLARLNDVTVLPVPSPEPPGR